MRSRASPWFRTPVALDVRPLVDFDAMLEAGPHVARIERGLYLVDNAIPWCPPGDWRVCGWCREAIEPMQQVTIASFVRFHEGDVFRCQPCHRRLERNPVVGFAMGADENGIVEIQLTGPGVQYQVGSPENPVRISEMTTVDGRITIARPLIEAAGRRVPPSDGRRR